MRPQNARMKPLTRWLLSYVIAVYALCIPWLGWGLVRGDLFSANDLGVMVMMPLWFPLFAVYGLSSFAEGIVSALPYMGMMVAFLTVMLTSSRVLARLNAPVA